MKRARTGLAVGVPAMAAGADSTARRCTSTGVDSASRTWEKANRKLLYSLYARQRIGLGRLACF
jgi:hypothetical protein